MKATQTDGIGDLTKLLTKIHQISFKNFNHLLIIHLLYDEKTKIERTKKTICKKIKFEPDVLIVDNVRYQSDRLLLLLFYK